MAENTVVNISPAMTRESLVAQAKAKYAPIETEVPGYEGKAFYRRLKALEQDEMYTFLMDHQNKLSNQRYWAKLVSLGCVDPKLTYEEAIELPEDYLQYIAERINDATTAHRDADEGKAADEPVPFVPLNSNGSASPSASADSPARSRK